MASIVVDNESKLQIVLTSIVARLEDEPNQLLFVDLEGVNLSRHGTIAIMQLLIPPNPTVYLIDIYTLGNQAFESAKGQGRSLRALLEADTPFKVFFDIRNDSDALYGLFGIKVAGIIDLQLLEYATRHPRGKFVNGLSRCIENDLPYKPGWAQTKANGCRLFAPEVGGKYEVFLERPIPENIVKYCEQDVLLMPQLLARYGPKLLPGIAAQIQGVVDDRVKLSTSAGFNGKGRHMAVGPNLSPARYVQDLVD